jgi:hypothetical protein
MIGTFAVPAADQKSRSAAGGNNGTVRIWRCEVRGSINEALWRAPVIFPTGTPDRRHAADGPAAAGPMFQAAGQGWMFSRSSRRLGCFGSQPSACRVWVLDEGWSAAKMTPRGP